MTPYLWLLPVGVLIGAFGTLIGAGGGFVLPGLWPMHDPGSAVFAPTPRDTPTASDATAVIAPCRAERHRGRWDAAHVLL